MRDKKQHTIFCRFVGNAMVAKYNFPLRTQLESNFSHCTRSFAIDIDFVSLCMSHNSHMHYGTCTTSSERATIVANLSSQTSFPFSFLQLFIICLRKIVALSLGGVLRNCYCFMMFIQSLQGKHESNAFFVLFIPYIH